MINPQEVLRHPPVLGEAVLFCTGINDLAVSEYRHLFLMANTHYSVLLQQVFAALSPACWA
jgi:hypothetical protein